MGGISTLREKRRESTEYANGLLLNCQAKKQKAKRAKRIGRGTPSIRRVSEIRRGYWESFIAVTSHSLPREMKEHERPIRAITNGPINSQKSAL
jgi:hypothetical protein